ILELTHTIIKLTGSRSKVVYRPLPVNDPKVRQPDITLAEKLLGWEPKVSLEEGLKLTIEWLRKRLEKKPAQS
ncbi:MAG TPA: SDR family NAD-dependent epimerase/dehydratase, partial [bacterium]